MGGGGQKMVPHYLDHFNWSRERIDASYSQSEHFHGVFLTGAEERVLVSPEADPKGCRLRWSGEYRPSYSSKPIGANKADIRRDAVI
jgi:hypothetical protein